MFDLSRFPFASWASSSGMHQATQQSGPSASQSSETTQVPANEAATAPKPTPVLSLKPEPLQRPRWVERNAAWSGVIPTADDGQWYFISSLSNDVPYALSIISSIAIQMMNQRGHPSIRNGESRLSTLQAMIKAGMAEFRCGKEKTKLSDSFAFRFVPWQQEIRDSLSRGEAVISTSFASSSVAYEACGPVHFVLRDLVDRNAADAAKKSFADSSAPVEQQYVADELLEPYCAMWDVLIKAEDMGVATPSKDHGRGSE